MATTCVSTAILSDMAELALSKRPQAQLEALKFLGHWIGDIHQPMHVSFSDDRGGNNIQVSGECSGTFHGMGDGCIIENAIEDNYETIANELHATVTDADRSQWFNGDVDEAEVIRWADESFAISTVSTTKYCVLFDEPVSMITTQLNITVASKKT